MCGANPATGAHRLRLPPGDAGAIRIRTRPRVFVHVRQVPGPVIRLLAIPVIGRSWAEGVQVDALRQYAERNNGEIIRLFRIAETASKHDERKTFKELMAFAKKNATSSMV